MVASSIGSSAESIRLWVNSARRAGTMPDAPTRPDTPEAMEADPTGDDPVAQRAQSGRPAASPYAAKDPGQGLSEAETMAILEQKQTCPAMGPAQIRAQLKRFRGWRISTKAITRVLKHNGYKLVHRGSRPEGPEPTRFEAPRPNALWQADFTDLRVGGRKLHLLVVIDDFSRFAVGHGLFDSPDHQAVIEVLKHSIARHGKPEAIRTDRGGAFSANIFADYLEAENIDKVTGRAYNPKGGGKIESLMGTVRRELWDVEQFSSWPEATVRLREWLRQYNDRRAHMGIDGLTPADRYFGRGDQVLAVINGISRHRQGALAQGAGVGTPIEELTGLDAGAPLEMLRLAIVDDVLELRFCGARVRLGRVEP